MKPVRIEGENNWRCPHCNYAFTFNLIKSPFHIYDLRPNNCAVCGMKFDWEYNNIDPPKKKTYLDAINEMREYLDKMEEKYNG